MSLTSPTQTDIFANYLSVAGAYDEFFDSTGVIRPHAIPFINALNRLGTEELASRWEVTQRVMHENGFAYTGHVQPQGKARPWELDALPILIPQAEWESVAAGLQQRALLLNLVLQDLYGPQRLLKEKAIPPELVFTHPGYLLPYHDQWKTPAETLDFYSADLARSPDGSWWVLADRTEAPSGIGYVLENRTVISRMYSELFRDCHVQRLVSFFQTFEKTVRSLANTHQDNPRVVVLSHGPTSPNYFEDAYLARYLGLALVEGGDLTVRNSLVFLKTLGGLLPVDVVMRRQNSCDCDPLELQGDSTRGVAGMVHAARVEKVAIANRLGSGLVESPVFMAFLPQICQKLLGEPLKIPGVATHWCGLPESLNYVLENLEAFTVYPAFRRRGKDRAKRQQLAQMSVPALKQTILDHPAAFAAQEKVARSCVATWNHGLQTAHVALRSYVVSRSGHDYEVMPGALARVSSAAEPLEPLEMSIQIGERSKDVWILADHPVEQIPFLEKPGKLDGLRRSTVELPSRSADNIFWLGRYLERADVQARLLRSAVSRSAGESRYWGDVEMNALFRALASQGQIEPGYALEKMRGQLAPVETVLPAVVFDSQQPGSIRSIINDLVRLGSMVRDRVSVDTWRIILSIDEKFQPLRAGSANLTDILIATDDLLTQLAALAGSVSDSMTRTHSYRFLELGRRIERSQQIISLVKCFFVRLPDVQGPLLETILEISDSLMTYRSRYLANLQLAPVMDLLITDDTNPRSLAYQYQLLAEQVDQLPRDQTVPGYTTAQRIAMTLLHSVRLTDISSIADALCSQDDRPFDQLTTEWEKQLNELSEAIALQYWVHSGVAHQLSDIRQE